MTFLWPEGLWGLALVPILVALYVAILRRKKNALAYSNLALVKAALGKRAGLRRHLPPALLLAAFIVMLLALARPAAVVTLPSQHETVILAIDVSGSMRADDVKPTRLAAAQAAARAFVKDTPGTTRVGVVAFAGSAALVQPPTRSREEVLNAIEQLQLQNATAVGSGILVQAHADRPAFAGEDLAVGRADADGEHAHPALGGEPRGIDRIGTGGGLAVGEEDHHRRLVRTGRHRLRFGLRRCAQGL